MRPPCLHAPMFAALLLAALLAVGCTQASSPQVSPDDAQDRPDADAPDADPGDTASDDPTDAAPRDAGSDAQDRPDVEVDDAGADADDASEVMDIIEDVAPDAEPDAIDTPDAEPDADTPDPGPTLAALWEGQAHFVLDDAHGPFGVDFGMHFISTVREQGQLWAYYIKNQVVGGVGRSATGLAISTDDGLSFQDQGTALDIGGAWERTFDGASLQHQVGAPDELAWTADTARDQAGYLSFGPYINDLPGGLWTVSFQLHVDNHDADDLEVVTLDVYDGTAGRILTAQPIRRRQFPGPYTDAIFNLTFEQIPGHVMEFRVFWHDVSYVRLRQIALAQGEAPFIDDRLASFPGVWRDRDGWFMVYEAAGLDPRWPGDVALATSRNGRRWTRYVGNPILPHETTGWERVNNGTPSLWRENGRWYLFYHGFDGDDVQIGVATGSDLQSLRRHPGNPVVPVSANGWDSGTVGARSIIKEGDWYYMAYEGSTDPPYDRAHWSTGLARSRNLLEWEKYPGNPVLPVTQNSFGFDGPEFVRGLDGQLHIYYRSPEIGNRTRRATLRAR